MSCPAQSAARAALTQLGPGTLALNPSDNYTGVTTITAAPLRANSGAGLPTSSSLVLNGGVLESNGTASFTRSIGSSPGGVQWTSAGGGFSANGGLLTVNLDGGAGAALTWGNSATQLDGTLIFGSATANNETDFVNPVDLDNTPTAVMRTIQVAAGQGGDFAKMIGGLSNSAGTAGLIKTGNGLLVLAGANSYNGGTQINAGNVIFSSADFDPRQRDDLAQCTRRVERNRGLFHGDRLAGKRQDQRQFDGRQWPSPARATRASPWTVIAASRSARRPPAQPTAAS